MTGVFLSVPRYISLVTSIVLCACESWTLTVELQRRIQAMEMRCYRKILHISHKDYVNQRESPSQDPAGNRATRKPLGYRKETQTEVVWSVSRSTGLAKTTLQGTLKGWKNQGRQKKKSGKTTSGNGQACILPSPRGQWGTEKWRKLVVKSSVVPQRPPRLRDRWRSRWTLRQPWRSPRPNKQRVAEIWATDHY